MVPPTQPIGSASPASTPPPSATLDLQALSDEKLSPNPGDFKKAPFRVEHHEMITAIETMRRYLSGDTKVDEAAVRAAITDWTQSANFNTDEASQKVLASLLAQLTPAKENPKVKIVLESLPGGKTILEPPKPAAAPGVPADGSGDQKGSWVYQKDKYYNVGLGFRQDTLVLKAFDAIGIPLSGFAPDQQYFNIQPSIDVPIGNYVFMGRLNYGAFAMRGAPGSDAMDPTQKTDPAVGYHRGVDIALVDPTSKYHFNAGMGLEFTGVSSAGDGATPGAVPRLHFFRQSEHTFGAGDFQFGVSSFYNNQETYLPLTQGNSLGGNSPVGYASSLYPRGSIPFLEISGRYYWNGRPNYVDTDSKEYRNKPFQDGEGATKVFSLVPSKFIMFNRARDASAFATDQVFLALEPFGPKASREQFDQISLGLLTYSALDGMLVVGNAKTRAEILRRGDWGQKGLMFVLDGGEFLFHVIGAASRADDPPPNQTQQQFRDNPGSVTDFNGRAYNMRWKTDLVEQGLSLLDYSDVLGTPYDENISLYRGSGGAVAAVGLVGLVFSGTFSGNGCGHSGSLLACSFPGSRDKYFQPGQNFTPQDMAGIERQYVVSTIASSLLFWGGGRFVDSLIEKHKPEDLKKSQANSGIAPSHVTGNLHVGANGITLGIGGQF